MTPITVAEATKVCRSDLGCCGATALAYHVTAIANRPQSSSASRVTAGAAGFLILSQVIDAARVVARPKRNNLIGPLSVL
jgi:hypothetical protein